MLLSGTRERYKPVGMVARPFFSTDGNKKKGWKYSTGGLYGRRTFNLEMGINSTWISSIHPRSTYPDARVIFASQMEAQRNRKRLTSDQITYQNSKSKVSERNTSKSLEHFSILPNQPGLQLDYDYLAPSSLSAIELLPHIKRNKGDWFLTKWWNAAKKWNLLTGRLKELSELQEQRRLIRSTVNLTRAGKSTNMSSQRVVGGNITLFDSRKLNSAACEEDILRALHDLCRSHRARIGDVHGCVDEVLDLLRKVEFMPGDLVLFLGDLVAKGPKSKSVIRGVLKRPWASSWTGPQTVYFGHDAARGLQRHANALGVDTVIVSVPSKQVYRDYRKAGTKTSYQSLVEEIKGAELQEIEQLEVEVEVEEGESMVSEDLSYLSRDSSLFETIQVLNQKKLPSDFDRLSDEEDPRKHLPVPVQSLISEQQPVLHRTQPLTVVSTISSDNQIHNNDNLVSIQMGKKEFSDRSHEDFHTTSTAGLDNHSLLNDGIDEDEDEVPDFDVDSFTNQLLERCEVLLQDYRARKEPTSADTITKAPTTGVPASERSLRFNDDDNDVVTSNSKNPTAVAVAVAVVQTSTRRESSAMDVGIQTVGTAKWSVSSSGTKQKQSRVGRGGDVSAVRVDNSSSTLSNDEEDEEEDENEDEYDTGSQRDGASKNMILSTVTQDGPHFLLPEAFKNDDSKPVAPQAVEMPVLYPDLPAPVQLPEQKEASDAEDLVVDLQYVQPYLHDDHVQELWRRLGEVDAALRLHGIVDTNSVRLTGGKATTSSQKGSYVQRRYYY
eukprot:gene26097-34704_t